MVGNRTLRDLMEERAKLYPDKEAFIFESRDGDIESITFAEFERKAKQLANGFLGAGIRHGDRVVVHLPNCMEFVISWFALGCIGAILVPTNIENRPAEMVYAIDFSGAVAVIVSPVHLPVIREAIACAKSRPLIFLTRRGAVDGITRWSSLLEGASSDFPALSVSSEDPVEILFTSGTTADPKGVVLTHANCLFAAEQISMMARIRNDDKGLSALPLFHVNAQVNGILSLFTSGATAVLLQNYSATRFWQQVCRHKATITTLLPALMRTIMAQPEVPEDRDHKLRLIHYAINCSDQEKEVFERRFGVTLMNGYGMSEAMVTVCLASLDGDRHWPSVGLPAAGREVKIVDEDGSELPFGQIGEIVLKGVPGRTIFKEYFNNPAATAETIKDGWLHTGDAGWMEENGHIHFFERIKSVIKRGGENVSAGEVERVLSEHPAVLEYAVISVPDSIKDEAIEAHVVLQTGKTATEEEIIAFCVERLAKFKVPSFVVFHDSMPKTPVGKIKKKELRSLNRPREGVTPFALTRRQAK